MIRIEDKSKCCGCSACMSVCPVMAITMKEDEMGFKYPVIDNSICIDCGRCDSVCSFHVPEAVAEIPIWSVVRFEAEMGKSQSGGFAYEVMVRCIRLGYVVYGVALDNSVRTVHMRAETVEELQKFRYSKYTQSDLGSTFNQIRSDLINGKKVLFTGTPCQCAGLGSFIGNALRDRLLLLDIVCHGVASPSVWAAYVSTMEKWAHEPVKSALFRDPRFGWHYSKETFFFEGWEFQHDSFRSLYNKNLMLRPSCSVCPFASLVRPSDMTSGDAWGIEKTTHTLNDGKAVSLCILSSTKGKALFPEIKPLDNKDSFIQGSLRAPSVPDSRSDDFRKDFLEHGYEFLDRKYVPRPLIRRLKDRTRLLLTKYFHL